MCSLFLWLVLSLMLLSACQAGLAVPVSLPSQPANDPSATPAPQLPSPPASLSPTPYTPLPSPSLNPPLPSPTPAHTSLPKTVLMFTGVIVPARCVQAAIDARGDPHYLYDEVRGLLSQADLAVGTLNATISNYPPPTGCIPTYVLVGNAENADALGQAGFDLMSVATNHIKNCGLTNCGDRAFFDTLKNLMRVGIRPVGAGKNLDDASRPVVVEVNGIRFGFVSLGQIEKRAFATEETPGIAVLTTESLKQAIAEARHVSDVVIAMPHWGPEDVAIPNWSQRDLAQVAVEAGADLVVGNHTHVVQAIQEIEGVPVFYGLGNFVFDQDWARDHQQGVILKVDFEGERLVGYELIPTHVDADGRVHLAGPEESAEVLERIEAVSRSLH